jgi:hypothetical protein
VRNNGQSDEPEPDDASLGPDFPEIERRLIEIQLEYRCLIILVDSWNELAKWIGHLCGEIARNPQQYVEMDASIAILTNPFLEKCKQ